MRIKYGLEVVLINDIIYGNVKTRINVLTAGHEIEPMKESGSIAPRLRHVSRVDNVLARNSPVPGSHLAVDGHFSTSFSKRSECRGGYKGRP